MNNIIKPLFIILLVLAVASCDESSKENPVHDVNRIESIVVDDIGALELAFRDTVSVDVEVYPATAVLGVDMIAQHQLLLQKHEGGLDRSESSAYNIVNIEKLYSGEKTLYRLYIADTDAGYGYRDTVSICYRNVDSVVESNQFEIRNIGTDLFSFSLGDGTTTWNPFNIKNDTLQIQVPNSFELKKARAFFKHNGTGVFLGEEKQISGEGTHDYSDFCNPLEYVVKGFNGDEKKYTIEVFNLPIVFVNTPDSVAITSRYEWLGNCSFIIRDTDGKVEDYGEANVKGRGNWTWRYGLETGKKPYAIKLANKPKDRTVLGIPGHKRWVLLANPVSYLPNPVGFEVNRRVETCKWAPRCRFVELMLNGTHQGLYLLCEQIKIDKNRVNITEMKKSDIEGEALTGGYLISYDDAYEDDDPIYYSQYYNLPFMIKNPDENDIKPEQLAYITDYINQAELSLYDNEKFQNKEFYNYFDVDSWIDYYLAAELWGALEMKRPRSIWFYKDRGGKLTAGPLWDMESNFFHQQQLYCNNALYYGRLFQCHEVVNRVKEKWGKFRSNIAGNDNYSSILAYIDSLYEECKLSASRDRSVIPAAVSNVYPNRTLEIEYHTIRDNILVKLDWLESQIKSW